MPGIGSKSCSSAGASAFVVATSLQICDWQHAQQMMRWLGALGLSDFAIFPAVGQALCECTGMAVGVQWLLAGAAAAQAVACALFARHLARRRQFLYCRITFQVPTDPAHPLQAP